MPFAGVTAAQAAPGDTSTSEARFLGGSLLLDGVELDTAAVLESASSLNSGSPTDVVDTSSIDLTALSLLNVTIPGGVSLPIGNFIELGAVNQYTIASDNGVSRAATGAVSDSGIVDVNGTDDYPANANLHLTDLLGEGITSTVANLDLEIGAITSEASLTGSTGITRDYSIAGAKLNTSVPAIGGLVGTLVGPGGVASTVDDAVAGLTGPNGALAEVIGTLNTALLPLVGNDALAVAISTDVSGALNEVLDAPVGDGVITIDLRTGTVEADLNALLASTPSGNGLNNLDPNQEILSPEVINALVDRISSVLGTVPTLVQSALTNTLNAAQLTVGANVSLLGVGVIVNVDGTLAEVAAGTATAGITLDLPVLPDITIPVNTILSALTTPINDALFGPDGVVSTTVPTVQTAVTGITTPLRPVFLLLNEIVSLQGNVQEDAGGVYDEIALRLTVGDLLGDGGIATAELARATVGPNAMAPAATPVISNLTPNEGPEAGGTEVTITGTGLTGTSAVTFDGAAGTDITVASDTELTVTTPAGDVGPADVLVTTTAGTSAPGLFTYLAAPTAPTITSLDPTEGPETGGTEVTITGTGFAGATGTTFEGNAGSAFTVDSDTQITVTTPAGAPGIAEVVIEHPAGNSTPGEFTYLAVPAPPTITGLNPTEGPETGGTEVTITGTGFAGATGVTFDGTEGSSLTVVSNTQIIVTTPAGDVGPADVIVTTSAGSSDPGVFTYLAVPVPPTITSLDPTKGPETGGTEVTITGTGFTDATGVTFDGTAGTAFTVDSDTEITVTTPAGTPGAVDAVVEHPAGDSEPGTFTYLAVPSITDLDPTEGPETGGTAVTITGTGFTDATGVTFEGVTGVDFTVDSDTQITVTTPAGDVGAADVIIEHPVENSTPGEFTYLAVPSITDLTPTEGPETGGTEITITGTGFT
ncbi:MAG: IPT/TIG domain-containing protein, partial [Leucobacter sp.]